MSYQLVQQLQMEAIPKAEGQARQSAIFELFRACEVGPNSWCGLDISLFHIGVVIKMAATAGTVLVTPYLTLPLCRAVYSAPVWRVDISRAQKFLNGRLPYLTLCLSSCFKG